MDSWRSVLLVYSLHIQVRALIVYQIQLSELTQSSPEVVSCPFGVRFEFRLKCWVRDLSVGATGKISQFFSNRTDCHELLIGACAIPTAVQQRFRTRFQPDSVIFESLRPLGNFRAYELNFLNRLLFLRLVHIFEWWWQRSWTKYICGYPVFSRLQWSWWVWKVGKPSWNFFWLFLITTWAEVSLCPNETS